MATSKRGSGRRRGGAARRGKGGGAASRQPQLTSQPTGRTAYVETRRWLLERHGPVCAYCERTVAERTITLDHVTPRRGQTAYDRRDNLVLCCKTCNASKTDTPILAFLPRNRSCAVALLKYVQHLSQQLVAMVKYIIPPHVWPAIPPPHSAKHPRRKSSRELFGDDDGPSPYLD